MPDYGARYTDKRIAAVDKALKETYRTAQIELRKKLADFNRKFEEKNRKKKEDLEAGKITKQEYKDWLTGQVFIRNQWESNIRQVNAVLLDHNRQAVNIINQNRLDVFAENYNFNAFNAERETGVSFNLYNAQAVAQLISDNPQLLPEWNIDKPKDYAWNYQKVNNIVKQGIIQGEGVKEITERLCRDLSTMNQNKMRMFARTALTEAQSAGRQQQMQDAHDMGIEVKKQWLATLDGKTRDSHRYLDGQEVPFDKPFKSQIGDIMFPGDPTADAADVFNCRCTMVTIYPKYDTGREDWRQNEVIDGQSYAEWKQGKKERGEEHEPSELERKLQNANAPTIAGVKRGMPMTHEQADSGRVNPKFLESSGYRINCQSCVVTYEARLRGYDVEVVPNDKKHPMCDQLSKNTALAWKNKDGSPVGFDIGSNVWESGFVWHGEKPTAKRFEKMLNGALADGARYTLQFKWKGVNAGHTVSLRKESDSLVIYDPQNDKEYRGDGVSQYLERLAYTRKFKGYTYYQYPGVRRIDDKEFDFDVANQIMIKKG